MKNEDNVRQINEVRTEFAAYFPILLNMKLIWIAMAMIKVKLIWIAMGDDKCEIDLDCDGDDNPCTVDICRAEGSCRFSADEDYTTKGVLS